MRIPEQEPPRGLTSATLDLWVRQGHLRLDPALSAAGRPVLSSDERAIARAMWRLVEAGFGVLVAARLARFHYTSGALTVPIGEHLALVMGPDLWSPYPPPPAGWPFVENPL